MVAYEDLSPRYVVKTGNCLSTMSRQDNLKCEKLVADLYLEVLVYKNVGLM